VIPNLVRRFSSAPGSVDVVRNGAGGGGRAAENLRRGRVMVASSSPFGNPRPAGVYARFSLVSERVCSFVSNAFQSPALSIFDWSSPGLPKLRTAYRASTPLTAGGFRAGHLAVHIFLFG